MPHPPKTPPPPKPSPPAAILAQAARRRIFPGDEAPLANLPRPPERVSPGARRWGRTQQTVFLVAKSGKQNAVAAWRAGRDIPVHAISPSGGLEVFCAASLLPQANPTT